MVKNQNVFRLNVLKPHEVTVVAQSPFNLYQSGFELVLTEESTGKAKRILTCEEAIATCRSLPPGLCIAFTPRERVVIEDEGSQ